MRRRHFEALRPVCPVCRTGTESGAPLVIAQVAHEENGHITQGMLHCSNADCLREYPIVDGIPLIVPHIRQFIGDNVLSICGRRDLSDLLESVIGDCCGPGSKFDQSRQQLSFYAWDHFGDLDPLESKGEPRPGSLVRSLTEALAVLDRYPPGPIIDIGCSVGRGSFELARSTGELVLGIDLNFPMLRLASEALRRGRVRYPRRRVGLVYERREFPAEFLKAENVDFWACDAAALPFPAQTFSLAVCMNGLDCLYAPRQFLESLATLLKLGGKAVLACPYDWSVAATPIEGWLGGHSQRAPLSGSSEAVLKNLLTPGSHPSSIRGLRLVAERENLPWHVRLHDRSTVQYKLHLIVAERSGG